MFKDLVDRSEADIVKSAAIRGISDVNFIQNNHKLFSSWIGGSIVSSLSSFNNYWVSNREWR
jgi:actin-related protein